jgi:farnesyl-diphosphate farnesyltransferase
MSAAAAREALLKKQGAYGKIKTHAESKLSQLSHLDEVAYALYYKLTGGLTSKLTVADEDTKFCDDILGSVSRSFAAVIRQLPEKCCLDVLIFYLVLRALDTIEDDMTAFDKSHAVKVKHLKDFYKARAAPHYPPRSRPAAPPPRVGAHPHR